MAATITVPEGWAWVAAALLSAQFLLSGQAFIVGRRRQTAGIEYPQLYAEKAQVEASKDAKIFNCAQRAHQNTLEFIPVVYSSTLLTAVCYPNFAAAACGTWVFGRILYTRGYITGDPAKRNSQGGFIGSIAQIGLLIGSITSVFKLMQASL
ncbi:membrane-associated proteins in eicosanoid and glutathione metabolism [Guyanagaster necrorhizus]|uniref:Membrane-associated proteins in eicosanoid and glutathione metabolism n=1 Tax=Guyanagaster necrorhizus TaxID=856835 RepID=A0A9P7VYG3_9AGAR|nr:membrane-associated proteins in eicosanoid and glutathione metabolism [Guyanagaster necrorhizus MCA 3950]KAG7448872.1 membrane-associated proteins in eicosanoid and glutathione metabolism [Guyanagaster necrorhizus MCA 3950]